MHLKERVYEVVDGIQLAQCRVVAGFCEHCNKLTSSIKGEEFFDQASD
jgi:hypothetical protein